MKKIIQINLLILITVTVTYSQNSIRKETLVYKNGEIDFIESYLNLCLLVDSAIDKSEYYKQINIFCKDIEKEIEGYSSPQQLIERINKYLFVKKGYKFNAYANIFFNGSESDIDEIKRMGYEISDYILMPNVLKNREGICLSLSLLYLTIAFELNLPIFGVAVPKHFFVRYRDDTEQINIETISYGKELSDEYYTDKSNFNDKVEIYLKNLNLEETIGLYSSNIGNLLLEENKNNESIECFNISISLIPNYPGGYFYRGLANDNLELVEIAINDYSKSIEINSDYYEALINRGLAYSLQGSFNKAIIDFTRAMEINSNNVNSYISRGLTFLQMENFDEAITDFSSAIKLDSNNYDAYYYRGSAFDEQRLYNEAINNYTMAINIDANQYIAYFNRGFTYSELGFFNNAINDYTKAIELNSTDIESTLIVVLHSQKQNYLIEHLLTIQE